MFRNTCGNETRAVWGILKGVQFNIVLTIYNDKGCFTSDTVKMVAMTCCEIFTPAAFSPSGDGLNDYFKPVLKHGQLIVSFQVLIDGVTRCSTIRIIIQWGGMDNMRVVVMQKGAFITILFIIVAMVALTKYIEVR